MQKQREEHKQIREQRAGDGTIVLSHPELTYFFGREVEEIAKGG